MKRNNPIARIYRVLYKISGHIYYIFWKFFSFIVFSLPLIGNYTSGRWFWSEPGTVIIVFHELSASVFEKYIKHIKKHWRIISLDDLVTGIKAGNVPTRSVVITFDDGYKSNHDDILPVLSLYKVPATFYLVTGVINTQSEFWWQSLENLRNTGESIPSTEYYAVLPEEDRSAEIKRLLTESNYNYPNSTTALSWQDVKEMLASGFVSIGSHTINHTCLIGVSLETAKQEIHDSKQVLESVLGIPITHFSYPYGDNNKSHKELCIQAGYTSITTSIPGLVTVNASPYELKRLLIRHDESTAELTMKITGFGHRLGMNYFTIKHWRQKGVST